MPGLARHLVDQHVVVGALCEQRCADVQQVLAAAVGI